jgi:uncharacterized membrane protein (UPF0127 family)
MRLIAIFISSLLIAGSCYGAGSAFLYSKTVLKIVPKPAPVESIISPAEKEKEANKPTEILPKLERIAKEFSVDVRSPQFLMQKDFIAFQPFTDKEGMLIVIDPPQATSLQSSNMLAKADVLFLMEDGLIVKIAPELSMHNLAEPVNSDQPVKAILFLKAGMAKNSDIKPGDRVENALFKTHPVVIEDKEVPRPAITAQPK